MPEIPLHSNALRFTTVKIWPLSILLFVFLGVLGTELLVSCMLDKYSNHELPLSVPGP